MPVSTAFLYISLKDPGAEALQITTCLSKSPVKGPSHPPGSPSGATYGERWLFPEPYIFLPREKRSHVLDP
jgi:hypothetical protein